jgi:hypothetical protein
VCVPEPLIDSPVRLLLSAAGAGAVGGVAVWLALVSADGSVRPWLVIALAVTGCLLAAMTAFIAQRRWRPERPGAGLASDPQPSARTDRERGGLESFERRVAKAMEDPGRFDYVLRRQLCDLAEHRLRSRFGVDSRTDPDRARELLGESLWHLMTTPTREVPTRQQLDSWIRAIEVL